MNLYPFPKVCAQALAAVRSGGTIHQQFLCSHCGAKQTMSEPNKMFATGTCEECNHITNIQHDGCNYLAIYEVNWPA